MVTVTVTSDWKPLAVPTMASRAEAGAVRAAFSASTTALEVTVAPDRASMPSPMAKGPVLPMNCSAKAASSPQRVPKPGVSSPERISMPLTAPLASRVMLTFTLDWKPWASPDCTAPVRAGLAGLASAALGAPKTTSAFMVLSMATSATHFRALLVAFSTAVEVTVAPDRASKEPPSMALMPPN